MSRSANHGIGGNRGARANTIHCASFIELNVMRRLLGYETPHGPRKPTFDPCSHCFSGIVPPLSAYPGVWQSLQPEMATTYRPRATSGSAAGGAATAALGSRPTNSERTSVVVVNAATSGLMRMDMTHSFKSKRVGSS